MSATVGSVAGTYRPAGLKNKPAFSGFFLAYNDASLAAETLLGMDVDSSGIIDLQITDNLAKGFYIRQGTNEYLTLVTTNGSEAITLGKDVTMSGDLTMVGDVYIPDSGVIAFGAGSDSTLTHDGTTGLDLAVTDNDSGAFTVKDGSANAYLTIDSTTGALKVKVGQLLQLDAAGGAAPASALLMGIGTTGSPATTATADKNMIECRVQSTATSGDFRGIYINAAFDGAGVAGDAVRGRATIAAATGGTVDGGAFTLEYAAGGSVAGQGIGCRGNVVFPDATVTGGTVFGGMSEYAIGGTSFVNGLTLSALHSFSVIGGDAATRNAQVKNLFSVSGVTSTSGGMFYENTAAVPGNADGSLRILINGTLYHILLFDAQA